MKRKEPGEVLRVAVPRETERPVLVLRAEDGLPARGLPCAPDDRPDEPCPGAKPPADPAAVAVSAAAMTAVMASLGFMERPDNGS